MRVIRARRSALAFAFFPGHRRHMERLLSRLRPGTYRAAACHHARARYQQPPQGDLQLLPAAGQPGGVRELHHDWLLLPSTRRPVRESLDPPSVRVHSRESHREAAAAGRKPVQRIRRRLLDLFAEAQLISSTCAEARTGSTRWGSIMTFSGKLAVPLAAIALPCVLAACGGSGSSAPASGLAAPAPPVIAAPGEWTERHRG